MGKAKQLKKYLRDNICISKEDKNLCSFNCYYILTHNEHKGCCKIFMVDIYSNGEEYQYKRCDLCKEFFE